MDTTQMDTTQTQLPRRVLWRRIDVVGLDACSFDASDTGYLVSGTALYQHGAAPACFAYEVSCGSDWSSRTARVRGWVGSRDIDFTVSRSAAGAWSVEGEVIAGVDGLLDIDLGFTPATNTNAIKRLGLAVGAEAETTAVWLDVDAWRFKPLRQVYRRLSETTYAYNSPSHGYSARLETDDFGIVRVYPDLWTAISAPGT